MKWAVCEHFRDYLYYAPHFVIYTDNPPPDICVDDGQIECSGHRWVSELADFSFTIKYRTGHPNKDADVRSRMPVDIGSYEKLCTESILPADVMAVFVGSRAQKHGETTWVSAVSLDNSLLDFDDVSIVTGGSQISKTTLLNAQRQDTAIGKVLKFKKSGRWPSPWESRREPSATRVLLRQRSKLYLGKDGLLYRNSGSYVQLLLPKCFHSTVFKELHQEMGDLRADRVIQLARERFYWPKMESDVIHFVTQACPCLKQRRHNLSTRAPLTSVTTSSPFELVSIDFLHLEQSSGGYEYILVIVDHFTRFAQAYPTKNKSSTTAADRLYNDFVLRFGFPAKILHDQGREFENKLFQRLHQLSGITRLRTTPYHPQGNGKVERFNTTLLSMLRTLPENQKSKWKDSLNKVVHAYNCTRNDVTGFSPFYLLFGRSPRLPIDLMFGLSRDEACVTHRRYAEKWQISMKEAYSLAAKNNLQSTVAGKKQYDKKVRFSSLQPGDRVLVRNLSERGGLGKLRSYWEQQIHVVIGQRGNLPVYEVRPERQTGKPRVLHRNLLLPCAFLPIHPPEPPPPPFIT